MTLRQHIEQHPIRSMLGAGIVPLAAFAVVMVFLWQEQDGQFEVASAEEPFIASKYDDRLLALDREAVDNAYRDKVEHLIATWFLDDTGQPARALNGVRTARKRYIEMQAALDKREADLNKLKELQR